jgi:hypothetical protein
MVFLIMCFGAVYAYHVYENSYLRDVFFTASIFYAVIAIVIFITGVKH